MFFSEKLLVWFDENGRQLPWRNISNAYYIWVSEIILQQTRVAQGISYYQQFIKSFPTIEDLAKANIDDVMRVWQGLGYYTRARNLQAGARQVLCDYGGVLPTTYRELLKIKGLGAYSAAALASFAFGESVPAVDGNVYRILSRIFGVFTPIDSTQGKKEFFNLAGELMDSSQPAKFNQAIIDFGALVCTYRLPACDTCIFNSECYAYRNNIVYKLPIKAKRIATRDRFFAYLMIKYKGYTFIKRRDQNDIWHSLYEFPLIETNVQLSVEEIIQTPAWQELLGDSEVRIISVSDPVKHLLTHLTIYATFIIIEVDRAGYGLLTDYTKILIGDLGNCPVPRPIDAYLAAEPSERYFRAGEDE